jgi:hypothetical protein
MFLEACVGPYPGPPAVENAEGKVACLLRR